MIAEAQTIESDRCVLVAERTACKSEDFGDKSFARLSLCWLANLADRQTVG